ncbi:MAG: RpiB/LacA/LacB family sugar-phosphate isomerase [Bacilli bacterium]
MAIKIGITADHKGYNIKQNVLKFLEKEGYIVKDYGTNSEKSVDFVDFGIKLSNALINKNIDLGIAFCGTGIGMSIICNKIKGVYCAKIDNVSEAFLAKNHNRANIISLNSSKNFDEIKEIITEFLRSSYSNEERHLRRIEKIKNYEDKLK